MFNTLEAGRTKSKADARTDKEEISILQPAGAGAPIQSSKTAESTRIPRKTPLLPAIRPPLLTSEEIHRIKSTPSSITQFIRILVSPAEELQKILTLLSIGIHSTSSEPTARLKDAASSSAVGSGTSSTGILSLSSLDSTQTARSRGAGTISAPRIHKKEVIGQEVKKQDQLLHHRGAISGAQIPEKEVTGGEEVKKEIINQLLHHRGALLGDLPTITILGIRGVGKTELSKRIVDDVEVKGNFHPISLPVGDHFDVNHLVKCIVERSVNFKVEPEGDDIQILPEKQGKRSSLVVLDDLRNLDKDQWDSFQRKLTEAAGTSTGVILITTPCYIVAKITSSITLYTFKGLDEDESWSLFEKIPLSDEQGRRPNDSRISDYGRKLISKCRGIPLAAAIMAKLLSDLVLEQAQSERDVLENLMSEYYNKLRPEYYNDLSSLAKACFAYCSLFPKNYLIDVQELIELWMAEEFLGTTHPDPDASLEDVRHEFLHRSIFQDVKYDELGMVTTCRMNPLMHDLATFIGRKENASVDQKGYRVPESVLRVSFDFVSEISFGIPESLLRKEQKLRTILLPASTPCRLPHEVKLTRFQCGAIFSSFKNLGVLDLHDLGIKGLPRSIGELKNLKRLDLSRNNIEELPRSITKLVHLQSLKLSHCHQLKKLPKNLQSLANLRHLRIDGCLALTHMPRGIRKLTSLQSLSYFVASNDFNSSFFSDKGGLSELSDLSKLAGGIEILHLERLKYDGLEARNQTYDTLCLEAKPHLHRLTLRWDHDQDNGSGWRQEDEENTLELLRPDSDLKVLFIVGYNGLKISGWLSTLKNLVKFSLYNCSKCRFLPPLDQLPSLKILELKILESLEFIVEDKGSEPSTSATIPRQFFPSLRELALTSCPKLRAWGTLGAEASFPCISRLQIRYCPNLSSMPLFPHLDEKLELVCCSMEPLMKTITPQTNAVASQSSLPLSKLKSMLIEKALTSSKAGEWLTNFTSLEDLHIGDCPNLTQLPRGFNDLCSLKSLTVENCPGLDMSSGEWNGLKNLNTLTVRRIPKLLSFPKGFGCATSVQHLELHSCSGLEYLSDEIGKLTSLKSLVISECYDLASLPKEMKNLKSLEKLVIRDCPKLLPRCQPETGNDWPYIKHIGIPKISVTQTPRELNLIGNLGK